MAKESESAEGKPMSRAMGRLKWGLMVFLFSLALFEVYILLRPRPAPVVLLPMDYEWKMSLSARFNRFTHGWYYRAKVFAFGLPKNILVEERMVTFERTTEALSALNLPEAVFSNQNVSVWVVPRNNMAHIYKVIVRDRRYDALSAPKVTTWHDSEAAISIENTMTVNRQRLDYGFFSHLLPEVSKWNTALTLRTVMSEPNMTGNVWADLNDAKVPLIRTNFAFAGRIQAPLKHDVVVLQTGGTSSGKCYLLMTAIGR